MSPKKNWISRPAFKRLSVPLRTAEGRQFERAALPYLRLALGDVRQAPPRLDERGIDLVKGDGEPFELVVQCKSSVERIVLPQQLARARASIHKFRDSGYRTDRYVFLFNRVEETVAHGDALRPECDDLVRMGAARRYDIWSHHDLLNAAFNAMYGRVLDWISRWNGNFREEQRAVEAVIGSEPLVEVPFDEYDLRIDAARLREQTVSRRFVADPLRRLTDERRRKIRLLLGDAGMGKTTTITNAALRTTRHWLVIRAGRIRGDISNAHALFETAVEVDDLVSDADDADRSAWLAVVGPVLKYLTQFDSGIGIIVDGLDEAPALRTSFGLQTFFNLFRRAKVPIIVTMRTSFWHQRRSDFETELDPSGRESTVQTLEVLDLAPWSDELVARAATRHLHLIGDDAAQQRIRELIETVRSGNASTEYGEVLRTPLFLRIILDLLTSGHATHLSRAQLIERWARLKVIRDVEAPARTGGERIPITAGTLDSDETVRQSFASMRAAARCMTEAAGDELRLRPDCTFEEIESHMGPRAPQSALALTLNSLLVTTGPPRDDGVTRLRFAHRLFQEFFLAKDLAASGSANLRLPEEVQNWLLEMDAG